MAVKSVFPRLCLIKTLVGDIENLVKDVVDVGVLGPLPLAPLLPVHHPVVPVRSRGGRGGLLPLQAVTLVAVLQHFFFYLSLTCWVGLRLSCRSESSNKSL